MDNRNQTKTPTIRDVAKAAGTVVSTVSYVLSFVSFRKKRNVSLSELDASLIIFMEKKVVSGIITSLTASNHKHSTLTILPGFPPPTVSEHSSK